MFAVGEEPASSSPSLSVPVLVLCVLVMRVSLHTRSMHQVVWQPSLLPSPSSRLGGK